VFLVNLVVGSLVFSCSWSGQLECLVSGCIHWNDLLDITVLYVPHLFC